MMKFLALCLRMPFSCSGFSRQTHRKDPRAFLSSLAPLSRAVAGLAPLTVAPPPRFIGSYDFANASGAGPLHSQPPQSTTQRGPAAPVVGRAEKWVVPGSGACISVVRLYKPAGEGPWPVLLVLGGNDAT